MRKRFLAVLLASLVCAAAVTGCSGSGESDGGETQTQAEDDSRAAEENDEMVYGEVTAVDESSITINIGTMRERSFEEGEESPADGTWEEEREQPEDGGFSMLDLTGEQREISVTDRTDLQRRSFRMAFQGQEDDGDGERPEMPGEAAGDFADGDGERPEMPEGGTGDMPQGGGMDFSEAMQNETIALEDIAEGDTVGVVLNEDGTAQSVTVFSMGGFSAE